MSDQPRRPVETPREWLRYAEQDLRVAEQAMRDELPTYHTICFLCQSAAEKFLKGYLIAQGWTLEKTHDMAALLEMCIEHDPEWEALAADGAVLNEYIVAGRYPGDIAWRAGPGKSLGAAQRCPAERGQRDCPFGQFRLEERRVRVRDELL